MAEYIDKSFVLYVIHHFGNMQTWSKKDIVSECVRKITSEKAADVAPAVQGKWNIFFEFPGGACWKCSVCGRVIEAHNLQNPILRFPYCHCGAKMESAYIIAGKDLEESK